MKSYDLQISGLLLKDAYRKAGSMEENGKVIRWEEGYIVTILIAGGSSSADIKKFTVRHDLAETIHTLLAEVAWGTLISLSLEAGKVTAVKVVDSSILLQ